MPAAPFLDFVPQRDGHVATGRLPARVLLERVGYCLFALFIFFACFTFLRPSPYDFTAIPAMAIWLALGLRFHRRATVFVTFLLIYHLGLLLALVPYLDEEVPGTWTFQSVYLMVTAIFFVMFFSSDTERRVELGLKAYLASCIFAALAGITSYFLANGIFFTMDGRAAGVFEDPNVLGSFLILGVLYLLRNLMTGEARSPLLSVAVMTLIASAVFLSFSRGSWLAFAVGTALQMGLVFWTSRPAIRRRIAVTGIVVAITGAIVVGSLLSVGDVAETFSDRATVSKDYDEGETGRFGNQLRSLPMLLERPNGMGPLRFRLTFGLDPHNSYIGGFANGGWLGGFAFLGLVLSTIFVGLRLCVSPSPYRRQAQIVVPALLMFFLQAFQIDIDHWRHVYFMMGMVWGLECARVKWIGADRRAVPALQPTVPAVRPAIPALQTAGRENYRPLRA